jgi:arabinan endo-1,5-alpha-L-arabinosidase
MGSQESQIGLATSTNIHGPWRDHGSISLPLSPLYNLIDPFVYQESESDPIYFTFGSYWSGVHQLTLNSPNSLMAFDGQVSDIQTLITNTTANYAVVEGATTWKHDTFYFVFFSVGKCCNKAPYLAPPGDEYHIAVCRAKSVTGPYFDRDGKDCQMQNGGTTILASHGDVYAPGGQGVMTYEGKDVMYYHYGKSALLVRRETKLIFDSETEYWV